LGIVFSLLWLLLVHLENLAEFLCVAHQHLVPTVFILNEHPVALSEVTAGMDAEVELDDAAGNFVVDDGAGFGVGVIAGCEGGEDVVGGIDEDGGELEGGERGEVWSRRK
jgi:hypothetical protein